MSSMITASRVPALPRPAELRTYALLLLKNVCSFGGATRRLQLTIGIVDLRDMWYASGAAKHRSRIKNQLKAGST